jgi:gamma-glutamylaminecyclotransferase
MTEMTEPGATPEPTGRGKSAVFVYGSLKKGRGAAYYLQDQQFLGRYCIRGPYRMLDLGYYPGLVEIPNRMLEAYPGLDVPVFGELYSVGPRTLRDLDRLEGHPTYYRRHIIDVYKGMKAWAYFLRTEYLTSGQYPLIKTGLWNPTFDELKYWKDSLPPEELGNG